MYQNDKNLRKDIKKSSKNKENLKISWAYKKVVTLVYLDKYKEHNNAVVLREILINNLNKKF